MSDAIHRYSTTEIMYEWTKWGNNQLSADKNLSGNVAALKTSCRLSSADTEQNLTKWQHSEFKAETDD